MTTTNLKLTIAEVKILNAMRTNEYNDCIEYATWSFTVIDNSGLDAKKARGTIASLVKKGLVVATKASSSDDEDMLGLTQEGKDLFFNTANGAPCSWGGPRLLEVKAVKATDLPVMPIQEEVTAQNEENIEKAKKAPKTIAVYAFTGMDLGNFPIVSKTAKVTVVLTKKGELSFNTKTGAQLDAAKPKFANHIGGTK